MPDAWVAVHHRYHRLDHRRHFAAVQSIAASAGGRPHWGKLHTLDAERPCALHPRYDDAMRVRARIDPAGVFVNDYLDTVFVI
jgi:L-gulonolactone oxidase